MREVESEYLTVNEVARALRIAPLTVYRAIHEGRLEAVRLGGNGLYRIPAASLDSYARPVRSHAVVEA